MSTRTSYKLLFIFILPFILLSCQAAKNLTNLDPSLYVTMADVNRSGDANPIEEPQEYITTQDGRITFEDELIRISFPEKDKYVYTKMKITNKSERDISIDWREVDFINSEGEQINVMVDGATVFDMGEVFEPEWNEEVVTTTIRGNSTVHHAFIPLEQIKGVENDYSPEDPNLACVGKNYDREPYDGVEVDTDPEVVEEAGVEGCSVIEDYGLQTDQVNTYEVDLPGTSFSINMPFTVGDNSAIYKFDFQIEKTDT